jgi:tetrahydromethanopterin S-methyltransferase subunit D
VGGIGLVEERDKCRALVNTIMNSPITQDARELLSGCTTGGLPRRAQLHGVIGSQTDGVVGVLTYGT